MTLVEILIATGVGMIVLAAVAGLTLFSARSFLALNNYADLDIRSRIALDTMSQELRQANEVTGYATNRLSFSITETNGVTSTVTYTHDATQKTLTRTSTVGPPKVLLTQCDSLIFTMFKRPASETDSPILITDPTQYSECKVVQIIWVCSRSIRRQAVNTESVQSAEVIIRKR